MEDNLLQLYRSESNRKVAIQIFISSIIKLDYNVFICLYDKLNNIEKLELNLNLAKLQPTFWIDMEEAKNLFIEELLSSSKSVPVRILEIKRFFALSSMIEAKNFYNSL